MYKRQYFVGLGFELAFKYRNPAIILADGVIGQMMEKVVLPAQKPRRTDAEAVSYTHLVMIRMPFAVLLTQLKQKTNVRL